MTLHPDLIAQCWEILQEEAPESISWNHYELAAKTELHDIIVWKSFLQLPDVMEWLNEERNILQHYELSKLTQDVSNSRSVGQAQLINAVEKITAANRVNNNTGPIFIYTYIPLNEAQKAAPNAFELKEDIFLDSPEAYVPIAFDDSSTLPT